MLIIKILLFVNGTNDLRQWEMFKGKNTFSVTAAMMDR